MKPSWHSVTVPDVVVTIFIMEVIVQIVSLRLTLKGIVTRFIYIENITTVELNAVAVGLLYISKIVLEKVLN